MSCSTQSVKVLMERSYDWFATLSFLIAAKLNSDPYCQVGEIALGLKYLYQQWPPIIHGNLPGVSLSLSYLAQ